MEKLLSPTQTGHNRRQRSRQPDPNPTPQRNLLIQREPPSRPCPRPRPRRHGRRTSPRRPIHRRATRRNRRLYRTRHEPARRRRQRRRRHRTPIPIASSDELGFGHGERGPGGGAVGEEDVGGDSEARSVAAEPDAVRDGVQVGGVGADAAVVGLGSEAAGGVNV